jgi:hypothetical protein|eukprot:evm.model.NODE_16074_length_6232_cov_31.868902.1
MDRLKSWPVKTSSSRLVLVLLGLISQLVIIMWYEAPCPAATVAVAEYDVAAQAAVSLAADASSSSSQSSSLDNVNPPLPSLAAPLIVACLANPRSVSTVAYNLARVLMEEWILTLCRGGRRT